MRTPGFMVRFVACCFLLSVATIDGKAQQPTASGVSTGSTYFYSSRGIGFKKGNGGFDVFQVQGGDQIGVLKVGGGHVEFKKLGDVSPELEKTVMDAVQDYQMGRVSPAVMTTVNGTAPGCTTMYTPSYWGGSSWKAMIMAAHLGSAHGVSVKNSLKDPFQITGAGKTNIVTFKNPEAETLDPSPKFCIPMAASLDPTVIKIGTIDIKKDHRELETCAGRCAFKGSTTDDWMPEKRAQAIDIKRISDSLVEITPKNPLPAGQYILGGPPPFGYYDFGVKTSPIAR